MLRKTLIGLSIIVAGVVAAAFATAPAPIDRLPETPIVSGDPSAWVVETESRVAAATSIIEGAEKRVRWYGEESGKRRDIAVVYLHGFSATRQEIAPVAERIADGLEANLYETRLSGHGLESAALSNVSAEDWLADGVESLVIGSLLGEKIVLVGTSTGATLALALADHELFERVHTLVLLSPNFAPRDGTAEFLIRPGGPQLARMLVGENRSWTAANDRQERYWTTTYPTQALVEMMRLVDFARARLPLSLEAGVLTIYSPNDQVVDTERIERSIARIQSPRLETVAVEDSGDPSNHVLAGDILSPENNDELASRVIGFVKSAIL